MDVAKMLLAEAEVSLAARERDLKELAARAAELKTEEVAAKKNLQAA